MSWLEAFLLGILQALTEFLPVSSSGHIELGKVFLAIDNADDKTFSVLVHVATVISTIIVFRRDVGTLLKEALRFEWNDSTRFISLLVLSAVPVGTLGLLFKDEVDVLFQGNLVLVGSMLLVTAGLLLLTRYKSGGMEPISGARAIIIGLAQTVAILPGISRSGATISTALLLGMNRERAARFSFLMAIVPILGAGLVEAKDLVENPDLIKLSPLAMAVGFLTALVVGVFACRVMLQLVKKGNLHWFAIYCSALGVAALTIGLFNQ